MIRIFVPDSHGEFIDKKAVRKFVKRVTPFADQVEEMVLAGDHLDGPGTVATHSPFHMTDQEATYAADVAACNKFLDLLQNLMPNLKKIHYMEGNHEQHVAAWCVKVAKSPADARMLYEALRPEVQLDLKRRGIKYYHRDEFHNTLWRGVLRLGNHHYCHGMYCGKHPAYQHVMKIGGNVSFGHVHRIQSYIMNTIQGPVGGWCFGTLAGLQPKYFRGTPSDHAHGFGWEEISKRSGLALVHTEMLL